MAAELGRGRKSDQPPPIPAQGPAKHDVGEGAPRGDDADEFVATLQSCTAEKRLHRLAGARRVGAQGSGKRRVRCAESPLLVEDPQEAGFRRRRMAEVRERRFVRLRSVAHIGGRWRREARGSQGRNRDQQPRCASRRGDAGAAQIDARRPPVEDIAHALQARRLADGQRPRQIAQAARARSLALHEPGFERVEVVCPEQCEHGRTRSDDPRWRADDRQARSVGAPILRRPFWVKSRAGLLARQEREIGGSLWRRVGQVGLIKNFNQRTASDGANDSGFKVSESLTPLMGFHHGARAPDCTQG